MRNVILLVLFLVSLAGFSVHGAENEWKLKDGTVIKGEVSTMNSQGVVFRLVDPEPGTSPFSERYPWNSLSDESLKEFAKNPKARAFTQFLVAQPVEQIQAQLAVTMPEQQRVEIVLGELPSPGRPHADVGFVKSLLGGGGLVLMLLLYAANLYASFEIAHFRNYHWAIVSGIAVVIPFLTPIIFLCLPRRREVVVDDEEEYEDDEDEKEESEEEAAMAAAAAAAAASAAASAPPPIPPTKYFKRGEFNINRRFIETKFAGFFRAIPSEDERDLHLVIKSARGEFAGRRILKITNTELTFQVPKGDGSATVDEVIPLNDVLEIQIRHRDATD